MFPFNSDPENSNDESLEVHRKPIKLKLEDEQEDEEENIKKILDFGVYDGIFNEY